MKKPNFAILKRRIHILLLLVFVFSGTEFGQLLRLPLLVQHYLEHKSKHQDLGIGEFLMIHYSQQHQEGANDTDDQLPFKSHHECTKLFSFAAPLNNPIALNAPACLESEDCAVAETGMVSSGFRSMIWQPPRAI